MKINVLCIVFLLAFLFLLRFFCFFCLGTLRFASDLFSLPRWLSPGRLAYCGFTVRTFCAFFAWERIFIRSQKPRKRSFSRFRALGSVEKQRTNAMAIQPPASSSVKVERRKNRTNAMHKEKYSKNQTITCVSIRTSPSSMHHIVQRTKGPCQFFPA